MSGSAPRSSLVPRMKPANARRGLTRDELDRVLRR